MTNRTIKFRAWDKELKQFDNIVAGNLLYSLHDEGLTGEDKYRFVLTEFTGLYDKNNKEIYEGDIVEIFQEKHLVNQFGFFNLATNLPGLYLGEYVKLKNLLEVVGNIYENPELLK